MVYLWKIFSIIRNQRTSRRVVLICLLFINVLIFLNYLQISLNRNSRYHFYLIHYCYNLNKPGIFQELDTDYLYSRKEKRIFFIETSCKEDIDPKQACALESAIKKHPQWSIYLVFVGPVLALQNSSLLWSMWEAFPNLHLVNIKIERFLRGTPLEYIWTEELLKQTEDIPLHVSVILRYLLLWKFGGIYMDLDAVVLKPFINLPDDFVGKQDDLEFGSILSLSNSATGRAIANFALESLRDFEPKSWASGGSRLLEHALTLLCGPNITRPEIASKCPDFKVYDENTFYPISKNSWKMLYKEDKSRMYILDRAHAVHMWNRKSFLLRAPTDSLYAGITAEHCPGAHSYYYEDLYFGEIKKKTD